MIGLGRQITNWPKRFHTMLEGQTEAFRIIVMDEIRILVSQQKELAERVYNLESRERRRDGVEAEPVVGAGNGTGGP